MLVGYARVSSAGQSLEVQTDALHAAGCEKLFMEKESGTSTDNRKALADALDPGLLDLERIEEANALGAFAVALQVGQHPQPEARHLVPVVSQPNQDGLALLEKAGSRLLRPFLLRPRFRASALPWDLNFCARS